MIFDATVPETTVTEKHRIINSITVSERAEDP